MLTHAGITSVYYVSILLVHNRDQMLVSNLGSAKKHKTVVSHSSCEFPLNTCEMPADRLLGLSFLRFVWWYVLASTQSCPHQVS